MNEFQKEIIILLFKLTNRAFYIFQTQGLFTVFKKTVIYFWAKFIALIGKILFKTNTKEYWDFRMKYDWNFVGGGEQTLYLAAGAMANVDLKRLKGIKSVLDFGCATGDSSILFKIFFPDIKIYLYDISDSGIQKALSKYSRFLPVFNHSNNNKYDLVYCSNVIEHVSDPRKLVNNLIELSSKYVLIQCPWNEHHPLNGQKISPTNKSDEHIWTIDDSFFNEFIKDPRIKWDLSTGVVPMAWEGGIQAFYFGEIISV